VVSSASRNGDDGLIRIERDSIFPNVRSGIFLCSVRNGLAVVCLGVVNADTIDNPTRADGDLVDRVCGVNGHAGSSRDVANIFSIVEAVADLVSVEKRVDESNSESSGHVCEAKEILER